MRPLRWQRGAGLESDRTRRSAEDWLAASPRDAAAVTSREPQWLRASVARRILKVCINPHDSGC